MREGQRNGAKEPDSTRDEIRLAIDIFIEPDEDMFHAFVPALKGVHAEGRTEKEAFRYAVEAVEAYLESLVKPSRIREVRKSQPQDAHTGAHAHTQDFALALT